MGMNLISEYAMQEDRMADLDSIQVSPSPENSGGSRNRGLIIGLITAAVLAFGLIIAGVGIFAYSLFQRPSSIPQLIGADTQIYGTLTPNLSDLPNVQRLQASYPELFVDQDPEQANQQLEELLGVNFEQDIAPWIGNEMAFAVGGLPEASVLDLLGGEVDQVFEEIQRGLEEGNNPGQENQDPAEAAEAAPENQVRLEIILASNNNDQAQAFLDKQRAARSDRGEQFNQIEYNGTTIYEQLEANDSPIAAFALVKDNVVFANRADAIQAMIDRDGGQDNLTANPVFQNVRESLPADAVGYLFWDMRTFSNQARAALEEQLEMQGTPALPQIEESLASFEALQGLGLSISIVEQGLHFDTAITMDLAKLTPELQEQVAAARQGVDTATLDRISAEALALMTFHIPASFKDQIMTQIDSIPDGREQLEMFEVQMGFNLEEDLLNWFQGDAAIVILPGEQVADFESPVTAYFAIAPPDKAAAESGMANIGAAINAALMGSGVMLEEDTVGNESWQVVKNPENGDALAGYGFIGDKLVIGLGNTALNGAANGSSNPISSNADFQAVYGQLAQPNGGVFYIAAGKAVDAYREAGLDPSFAGSDTEAGLDPLRAIGAAGDPGISEQGLARARLVIHLK